MLPPSTSLEDDPMFKLTLSGFGAALLALDLNAAAQAAPPLRVFVSATGSDSSTNCSFAAPCRMFQKAHDTVGPGGEINVLDPAGYGSLSINRSISIQGHGFAGISVGAGG